jgi:hypothetical protein
LKVQPFIESQLLSRWNALSSGDTSKVFVGRSGQTTSAAGKVELAGLQAQNDRFSRSFAEAERIFRNVVDSLFDSEPSKAFQKWGINKTRNYLFTWLDRQAN